MKLFIDTNVIIDAYSTNGRERQASSLLLGLGEIHEFELLSSPSQWTDVFYILSGEGKSSQLSGAKEILKSARKKVGACMMGEEEIDRALASPWKDFENAVVHQGALSAKADAIISNNKKDYEHASIPVFTASEFFDWMEKEHGVSYAEYALD